MTFTDCLHLRCSSAVKVSVLKTFLYEITDVQNRNKSRENKLLKSYS